MNNQVILAIPDLTVLEELDPVMQEFLSIIGMVLPTSRRMPGTRSLNGKMIIHAQVKPSSNFIDTFVTMFKTAAFADWELMAAQDWKAVETGEVITDAEGNQSKVRAVPVFKPVPATFIDYMEDDVDEDGLASRPTEMKLHKFASAAPWVLA